MCESPALVVMAALPCNIIQHATCNTFAAEINQEREKTRDNNKTTDKARDIHINKEEDKEIQSSNSHFCSFLPKPENGSQFGVSQAGPSFGGQRSRGLGQEGSLPPTNPCVFCAVETWMSLFRSIWTARQDETKQDKTRSKIHKIRQN